MESLYRKYVPTIDFAYILGVKSTTIHQNLCLKGHYMGIRPIKLPNGRLMWSKEEIQHIMENNIR